LAQAHRRQGELIIAARSGGFDGDAGRTGAGLGFDENLYVVPECYEKVHQPFDRETFQFVMEESRDLRLVDSERCGDLSLSEPLSLDNPVESGTKPGLSVEFSGIWKSKIGKDVAAAADHLIGCGFSHVFSS
jgi:hypothetical protein